MTCLYRYSAHKVITMIHMSSFLESRFLTCCESNFYTADCYSNCFFIYLKLLILEKITTFWNHSFRYSHCIHNWPVRREKETSLNSLVSRLRSSDMMHCCPFYLRNCSIFACPLARSTGFSRPDLEVSPLPPPLVVVHVAYPHYSACLLSWQSRFPPITSRPWQNNRKLKHQTFLVPRTPTGSIFAAWQPLRMSRRSWAAVTDFKTRVLRLKPEVQKREYEQSQHC